MYHVQTLYSEDRGKILIDGRDRKYPFLDIRAEIFSRTRKWVIS